MKLGFEVVSRDSFTKARLGICHTGSGDFDTPNFMPVGTQGSVKGVDAEQLGSLGAQIILVNTYHLWIRPGSKIVNELGGIHSFTGWGGPILSDSGGFQVFSLKDISHVTEQGVEFRSHLDGAKLLLSPERSIEIQEELGVDIAMVLDECPPAGVSKDVARSSLERTIRWAKRSLGARKGKNTLVFGITQGATFRDLRAEAAQMLSEVPLDGMAIGGVSVGEPKDKMYEILEYHPEQLPAEKIRYLMGVGTPEDMVTAVKSGIDLFDCVMPTRAGRFGRAFISGAEPFINIRNSRFMRDKQPLDPDCTCLGCRKYSKAYLHHLFRADEMLGPQLLSIHNLSHYMNLMRDIRESIKKGTFQVLYDRIKISWAGQLNLG